MPADQRGMDRDRRNFGLDVMRCIAISCVLTAHGLMLFAEIQPLLRVPIYGFGVLGVEFFFVLSGFLIGRMLFDVAERRLDVRQFLLRRWFRTLPNYYLFLAINAVLFHCYLGQPAGNASYMLFAQMLIRPADSAFFAESWSLAVEEWFYLLAALVAAGIACTTSRGRSPLLLIFIAVVCIWPALRAVVAIAGNLEWDAGIRKVTLLRLDAIAWGVLASYGAKQCAAFWVRLRWIGPVLGCFIAGGCLAWLLPEALSLAVLSPVGDAHRALGGSLWFSVLDFALVLTLPGFHQLRPTGGRMWCAWVGRVSQWSYALYLVHFPLLLVLMEILASNHLEQSPLWALGALVLWLPMTVCLSMWLFRFYEHPLTNLRERFR